MQTPFRQALEIQMNRQGRSATSSHMTSCSTVPADVSSNDAAALLAAHRDLIHVESLAEAARCLCASVRELVGADGATFVLREADQVYYAEEDAVGCLWKGRRFPTETCISGWAVLNETTAVIEDIYDDPRIPVVAYRPTFVQSLCMAPMGRAQPLGALGSYWASRHRATEREIWLLEQLAEAAHTVCRREADTPRAVTSAAEGTIARLLAVIAHDLRQPLSSIVYGAQLLTKDGVDAAKIAEHLARSVGHANDLVSEISGVAESGRDGLQLNLDHVSLDELCEAVVSELDPTRERVRIESVPTRGLLDAGRLRQAIGNLVRNALEHGHREHPVTLSITREGALARLAVHNRGPVIPAETHQALPQPFQQFSRSRAAGSVGLGLYIVDQIVRAHGGRLDLESSRDAGTAFSLTLPLAPTTLMTG